METKNNEIRFDSRDIDDTGYSERKLDSNTDLQAGQWLDLSKGSTTRVKTPQVQAMPSASNPSASSGLGAAGADRDRLQKLKGYSLDLIRELEAKVRGIGEDSADLKEVEKIQSKLQAALRAIQFEQKGSLDITKLPKEVQDLLK